MEHQGPDMPVPAEPYGPMWPGELSGTERADLKSENQTLLLGGILERVRSQRCKGTEEGVGDQKAWT